MKAFVGILLLAKVPFTAAQEIDFGLVDELVEREKSAAPSPRASEEEVSQWLQKESFKAQLKEIKASPLFTGRVLRGSKLFNLKTGKTELVTEDINVRAKTVGDNAGYIYLQNDQGELSHKTLSQNVSNIEEVVRMHEPPLRFNPLKPRPPAKVYDDELRLFSETNLHLGLTSPRFTKDLVNDNTGGPAAAVRYELQTYSPFSLPFEVGANAVYETINGDLGNGESYSLRSLSLGPLVKTPFFFLYGHKLKGTFGLRTSLFARAEEKRANENARYRLAQTSFQIGIQKEYDLEWGAFILGANVQRQWSKASTDSLSADLDSGLASDDSFYISFGHKLEWL